MSGFHDRTTLSERRLFLMELATLCRWASPEVIHGSEPQGRLTQT